MAEGLEPDGLQDRVVHDQEVSVKLIPSSAAVFGRPGAGAREGEPTAGQRVEIHAGPISPVRDQGAVEGAHRAEPARRPHPRPESGKPGDSPLAHDGVTM